MNMIKRLWKEDEGATMVEYGILVAIVSVAAIAILVTLGGNIKAAFTEASDAIGNATEGGTVS